MLSLSDKISLFKARFAKARNYDPLHERLQGFVNPVVRKAIVAAIKGKYQISIFYLGDKQNRPGWRTVEPYCYGQVKGTGNDVLRAYQVKGISVSHHFPMWRLFRLDRILNITSNTTHKFTKPRPLYNFFWDFGMVNVVINAKFDDKYIT
jgi:hypothetical protein